MFPCEFEEISRNNFFTEYIWGNAFGLSFVNPRKKSVKEFSKVLTVLSFQYRMKERSALKKRQEVTIRAVLLKSGP